MADRYVLTLDLGSSGLRAYAVPVERPWDVQPGAERRYRVVRPRSGGLWERFDPSHLRAAIFDVLGDACRAAAIEPNEVAAISVTAQRGGLALLRDDGTPVHLAPNTDVRAVFEGAAIDERLAGDVYARTGHLPSMFFTPAKLRWWTVHHPVIAKRIATATTLGTWAVRELTGELAETPTQLAEAGLLDVTSATHPADLLHKLDVSPDLLPRMIDEGEPTAGLHADAAVATGLSAGTPVYLAGPDTQLATLGAGCAEVGDTCVAAGWSAPIQRVTSSPVFDDARRTWVGLHPIEGRWTAESNPGDTGRTLDTVRRLLGVRMTAARFDALAASAPERTEQVLALWGPRALDMSNPGMSLGGLLSPTPITFDGIDAATVARASLENVSFALRECVALLDSIALSTAPVALTGGMAASDVFARMLASVLDTPVAVQHPRGSAIGAAVVASRPRRDWAAAAAELAGRRRLVEPDARASIDYRERFGRWQWLRGKLDELAENL
jgi:xylulokinase